MTLRRSLPIFAATACCVAVTGCVTPGPRAGGPPIARVVTLYELNPWLNLDPGRDAKPEGFSFVMYLFPEKAQRGVHREGTLHVGIFQRRRAGDGDSVRELVDTWNYPTSDIHRSATPNQRFGDFYRVRLSWMPYDLSSAELEVEARFEDRHGRITHAASKNLLVPKKAFFR